jgi:hypothetical protein
MHVEILHRRKVTVTCVTTLWIMRLIWLAKLQHRLLNVNTFLNGTARCIVNKQKRKYDLHKGRQTEIPYQHPPFCTPLGVVPDWRRQLSHSQITIQTTFRPIALFIEYAVVNNCASFTITSSSYESMKTTINKTYKTGTTYFGLSRVRGAYTIPRVTVLPFSLNVILSTHSFLLISWNLSIWICILGIFSIQL